MKIMECLGHRRQGRIKVVNSEGGTPAQSKGKQPGQGYKRPMDFRVGKTQQIIVIEYGLKKAT